MKNIFITFFYLIYKEILLFAKVYVSKLIDIFIIVSTNIIIFTYLMPSFGLKANYGPFIVIGLIPLLTLFDVISRVYSLVGDISENKKISFILTLPITSTLALASIPIGWAAASGIVSILVFPIAKIILYKQLILTNFSFFKFIVAFILSNIMFGFFAFWLASLIKDEKYTSWIWARVVNPLFMLGGYFYTWYSVFDKSEIAGYINLINPLIYTTEAIRASVFGQSGYLNYYVSISAIIGFILIFSIFGIRKIKKRLDCV
ncbi:MAG: hypothetical protein A3F40_03265 [Chlamydiae bacterium RIFCSPHIGHO2_12_FULL_27_8]|nr:MAG: hypothetical protein A3F40_03265 [Chlamydiae bacterium RIFCSPHIGHO2_12_FULL_27_8]OGN64888.1 MAG: hypothetical protein A2888_03500 [Chlamydiae bacterium RIFCSPLOWO2_01_FULL_28_7]